MSALLLMAILVLGQEPPKPLGPAPAARSNQPLDKSPYFAFVDRDYIFTLEIVKPGVPLLNFISMADQEHLLPAKEVRLTLENRKAPGKYFMIDTANPREPVIVPSVRIRPKSSFGLRIQGEFGSDRELLGATVRIGEEDFKLVPLSSFDFENLVLKVNRLNLGSPDLDDDWRVLKLEEMGVREPVGRRRARQER
jgi:hypothetical protein